MQAFEFLFRLSIMTGILNREAVRVGVEDFETHVDADHAARLDMLTLAFGLDSELHRISIGTAQEANSFDLLHGKGFDVLSGIAYQAQATNAAAIVEGTVAPIGV